MEKGPDRCPGRGLCRFPPLAQQPLRGEDAAADRSHRNAFPLRDALDGLIVDEVINQNGAIFRRHPLNRLSQPRAKVGLLRFFDGTIRFIQPVFNDAVEKLERYSGFLPSVPASRFVHRDGVKVGVRRCVAPEAVPFGPGRLKGPRRDIFRFVCVPDKTGEAGVQPVAVFLVQLLEFF